MAEPHRRVTELVQEQALEIVLVHGGVREGISLVAGVDRELRRQIEEQVAREGIGEVEIVARGPVANRANEREARPGHRRERADADVGRRGSRRPTCIPASATGPTNVTPATSDQVWNARWSAASKAPAPYWASIAPRSAVTLLPPTTSEAIAMLGCTVVPSGMKPQLITAGVPCTGSSHFEPQLAKVT